MLRDGDDVDLGRRGFLLGRLAGPTSRTLGPAPPCRPPAVELCRECDAPCIASCERGIIERHAADHSLARVPYLSFESTGCTFCGDCVEACPVEQERETYRIGLAVLDSGACMGWNGTVCTLCRFACDRRAIRLDPRRRPSIDAQACTGCGACVGVCPARALEVVG